MLVYAYLRLFVCYRVWVTLTLALFILCWQTYALLKKYMFSLPYCLLFLHHFCLFSGFSCTERVSESSESTDSVSVVGGVLSLIILIIGVSALVIIILIIKNQDLKAMLTQAKE